MVIHTLSSFSGRSGLLRYFVAILLTLSIVTSAFVLLIPTAHGATCGASTNFITTWKTDNPGSSNNTSLTLTADPSSFNYNIDWDNDGIMDETLASPNTSVTHDFGTPGTYTIQICGSYPYINWVYSDDEQKLISVDQWGDNAWTSMANAFDGALNMNIVATDIPDLSLVESTSSMFSGASSLVGNSSFSSWDLSNVTNTSSMFEDASLFNQDIGNWNVGNVTNMSSMFEDATAFNQSLENWDVADVSNMTNMLSNTSLSVAAYDATLAAWSIQTLQNSVTLGADSLNYCHSGTERSSIISTHSWTINDASANCLNLRSGSNLSGIDIATLSALVDPDSTQHTVRLLKNGLPLAQARILFDDVVDWSIVDGDINTTNHKSVISGLGGADAVIGNHTLYIPKAAFHNAVVICPNALTLSQVSESCPNARLLTADDSNVSIVTVDDETYWKVDDLSGTGGQSIVDVPGAPNTGIGTNTFSAAVSISASLVFAVILTVVAYIVYRRSYD